MTYPAPFEWFMLSFRQTDGFAISHLRLLCPTLKDGKALPKAYAVYALNATNRELFGEIQHICYLGVLKVETFTSLSF